jgi:hypothetical protein
MLWSEYGRNRRLDSFYLDFKLLELSSINVYCGFNSLRKRGKQCK